MEAYSYVYTGSRLTQETVTTVTTTDEGTETTTDTLDYFYGVNGPTMVTWNGTDYYYLTNAQGDIVALLDESGNLAVQYSYDAWGHPLSTTGSMAETLGSRNSLRYRGYVFDTETGLYYLQSRYFNPKMARFINADGVIPDVGEAIQGYNMFAYCFNNPVNMLDSNGNWPSWGQVVQAVATVAVATVFVAAVVASAGAVGVAAGVTAASIGATGSVVSAAITVGTVGTYAVAAGIEACALSNAGEILTGTNVIRDKVMGGSQGVYDFIQTVLSIAGTGAVAIGYTNPGVTGNAAKPSKNAQVVHKVPTEGPANSSFDKLYKGKPGEFQRVYYDYKGKMNLQIDFTNHDRSGHSNPHLHTFGRGGRHRINLWYLE